MQWKCYAMPSFLVFYCFINSHRKSTTKYATPSHPCPNPPHSDKNVNIPFLHLNGNGNVIYGGFLIGCRVSVGLLLAVLLNLWQFMAISIISIK